jgi:hypothetical protein
MSLRSSPKRFRPVVDRCERRDLLAAGLGAATAQLHSASAGHFQTQVAQALQKYRTDIVNNTTERIIYDVKITSPGVKPFIETGRELAKGAVRNLDWTSEAEPKITISFKSPKGPKIPDVPVTSSAGVAAKWQFTYVGKDLSLVPG